MTNWTAFTLGTILMAGVVAAKQINESTTTKDVQIAWPEFEYEGSVVICNTKNDVYRFIGCIAHWGESCAEYIEKINNGAKVDVCLHMDGKLTCTPVIKETSSCEDEIGRMDGRVCEP